MGKLQNIIIEKRHVEVRDEEERERVALQLEEYFHYRSERRDGLEEETSVQPDSAARTFL